MTNSSNNIEERTTIDLDYLTPNKFFIYPLYSDGGEKILDARVSLTNEKINEIRGKYGKYVYYINSVASPVVSREKIDRAINLSAEIMREILHSDKLDSETYHKSEMAMESIISDLTKADVMALNFLKKLKNYEEYLFHHSVNVGVLSALLAKKMDRFSNDEIKQIGLGGYLIDIGQMKIDKQLLKHNGAYNVADQIKMKRHPQLGYELLKKIPDVNPIVTQTVLFHHEKFNERGYYGLPYANLPLPPKIASLCDVYDALTSQRPYRDAYTPAYALRHIVNSINVNFSYELVSTFINYLGGILNNNQSFYGKKDLCELNTNEIAVVKDVGRMDYLKPVVFIFCRFNKIKNQISVKFSNRPIEVNLELQLERHVTKFITNSSQIEALKARMEKSKALHDYL